jgi:hypothetical protein
MSENDLIRRADAALDAARDLRRQRKALLEGGDDSRERVTQTRQRSAELRERSASLRASIGASIAEFSSRGS